MTGGTRAGRNDPCPCGSGRKFKHCHGRDDGSGAAGGSGAPDAAREVASAGTATTFGTAGAPSGRVAAPPRPHPRAVADGLAAAAGHAQAGRAAEAAAIYRGILADAPTHPAALHDFGMLAFGQGRIEIARDLLQRAVAADPRLVPARFNLGVVLQAAGDYAGAADAYRAGLKLAPNDAQGHNNLGNVLDLAGDVEGALSSYRRAQALADTPAIRRNLALCLREAPARDDRHLRALCARALGEAWIRPADLAGAAIGLLCADPLLAPSIARAAADARTTPDDLLAPARIADVAAHSLLRALCENTPACDAGLERWLTRLRAALLANPPLATTEADLAVRVLVARQCFVNDYVFVVTADEQARVDALRIEVEGTTFDDGDDPTAAGGRDVGGAGSGGARAAAALATLAAYVPLHRLANAEGLAAQPRAPALRPLLVQQLDEPAREARLAAGTARATPIVDAMSQAVRAQYEAHPYPRWIKTAVAPPVESLARFLSRQFPAVAFAPPLPAAPSILVAGCGTGQEAIDLARAFTGARVYAVDLSLASLGYARRKAAEAGLDNIEFAQADLLALPGLGRRFDLVSSMGVLHHLDDPAVGLRALVACLAPGGFARLGFYSEAARIDVVAAREFIAARGFRATDDDIRRARVALVADPGTRAIASRRDFYALPECRDLLFHVNEHRHALPEIGALLGSNGLEFIGFLLEPRVLARYRAAHPEDAAAVDLRAWQSFEDAQPDTFRGMYRFWARRGGSAP